MVSLYVAELPRDTTVISGGARGVDTAAIGAARALGMNCEIFPAQWEKFGKSAGFRRNIDIVAAADKVVAFWDGESKGTKLSIDLARDSKKPLEIILVPHFAHN